MVVFVLYLFLFTLVHISGGYTYNESGLSNFSIPGSIRLPFQISFSKPLSVIINMHVFCHVNSDSRQSSYTAILDQRRLAMHVIM